MPVDTTNPDRPIYPRRKPTPKPQWRNEGTPLHQAQLLVVFGLLRNQTEHRPLHQVQLLVVFGLLRIFLNRNVTNETKSNTVICCSISVSANTFGGICPKQAEAHYCDCRYHPIRTGRFIQDPTREAHNDAISVRHEYTRLNSRSSRRMICGVHFRFCKLFYWLCWFLLSFGECCLRQK